VKLRDSGGSITTAGKIDLDGEMRDVVTTHERAGDATETGFLTIRSKTRNLDGRVIDLTTVTRLGPEGLPESGETVGVIRHFKGKLKIQETIERVR